MKASLVALSGIVAGCACLSACEMLAGIENLSLGDGGGEASRGDGGTADDSGDHGGPDASTRVPDDGGTDGGADGSGQVADGETDSGSSDGQAAGDTIAPSDAPSDAPRNSGFCASLSPSPTFCQDFDEPGSLPGNFSGEMMMNGSLALTDSSAVSPPNSLAAQDDPLGAGGVLDTALRAIFPTLPMPPNLLTLDFQIEPVAVDPGATAVLVAASLDFVDAAGDRYSVQFTLFQQGTSGTVGIRLEEQAEFTDGGTFYQPHALQSVPVGAWTEVVLKLTRSGPTSATATVALGGTQVLSDQTLTMDVDGTRLTLAVGSAYESTPSAGWTTQYDNVVLDIAQPP